MDNWANNQADDWADNSADFRAAYRADYLDDKENYLIEKKLHLF